MDNITCICPCLLGVEGLLADELKKMGMNSVKAENGRVLFSSEYYKIARANICSRYAERILILLGRFNATNFEELFQGVKSLPWENWIGKNDKFPVKGSSINSKLRSIPNCQSIIKKAIVEKLKLKYKIPWFEETGNLYQVQFLIMKNEVSIMIDTSGNGLHKRGYRQNSILAPIKETLAAAMVNLAHVKKDSIVYDPFCGSGTILIEAALYAMNIAPGLRRRFCAETWLDIPKDVWMRERERAQDLINKDVKFEAYGYDIDKNALELTNDNAKKAGILSKIHIKLKNINNFKVEDGIVICNPPYGERLLDVNKAEQLYKVMGRVFKSNKNTDCYIISPDNRFESYYGKKADKRRKLYNGMIKCQYYMYFKK